LEAIYMDQQRKAAVGDVVMSTGDVRAIVIGVQGTFVKILAIGTSKETGDTFVLTPRYIHDLPASQCHYLEDQKLNLG